MFSFFIIMIIVINLIVNSTISDSNKIAHKYFENIDLNVKGIICNIEEQTDTHKYLITLKNTESNYKDYEKPSPLGSYFCITKGTLAIFADHFRNYRVGDSIIIGGNDNDLIKCISSDGKIKMIKKRQEGMLYTISKPNKRMKQLIKIGCE